MIPCANPLAQYASHRDEILAAVTRVLESGAYVLGPEVRSFEHAFSQYTGVEHAIGVNSGTDALIIALKAMDVGPGDEVITVSLTALATVSAIISCGAIPVLVDLDPVHYTMCPDALKRAITNKTKVIIPVHLYGQCADLDAIMSIATESNLLVIEDCAQAAGATYKEKRVGSIGHVGCFSFYPTKNLGAIGDGGAIVSNNTALAERIKRLRQYGWDDRRKTVEPGLNSRLDEVQAAILKVKLQYLDDDNNQRRSLAKLYRQKLASIDMELPAERKDSSHVYHLFVAISSRRDAIIQDVKNKQIGLGMHYPEAAHNHGGYDRLCRIPEAGLPVTDKIAKNCLSLPMFPELGIREAERVISALKEYAEPPS